MGRVQTALSPSRFLTTFSLGLGLLVIGCASTGNTLAQDLAWERWQKCSPRFSNARLQEIRPDGQIWFSWSNGGADSAGVRECLQQAAVEQAQRRPGVKAVEPAVALSPAKDSPLGSLMAPVWKPGYEWAFRWESPRGKGTFVWSVDREEIVDGVEYYVVKSGTRESYWRKADLAYYMDKVEGDVETRQVPPDLRYSWPMTPGKTWETRYTQEKPRDRQTTEVIKACKVEGEENVTVPAGTFRTLKIACRSQRTGSITDEWWYSPEVKHWIREVSRFTYGIRERELMIFKVR